MAEFKLARLRFTWSGAWTGTTFYNRDAIVQYEGKTYVCQYPHTSDSANFYTDLAKLNPTDGKYYWALLSEGKKWKGIWTPTTVYSRGNIVTFGGTAYFCVTEHTSTDVWTDNSSKWAIYAQNDKWENIWVAYTQYGVGDIVRYGGVVYRCITAHKASGPLPSGGLEQDQANWATFNNGIDYKGLWVSSTRYRAGDVVKVSAELWKCTAGHTAPTVFDGVNWSLYLPGENYMLSVWAGSTVYQQGDVISYGGYDYVSLIPNNVNNNPFNVTAAWSTISNGYKFVGDWDNTTQYKIGSIVRRGGWLFSSTQDVSTSDPLQTNIIANYVAAGSSGTTVVLTGNYLNQMQPGDILIGPGFKSGQAVVSFSGSINSGTVILDRAPDSAITDGQALTVVGVNNGVWQLVCPGMRWKGFWAQATSYLIGDMVLWGNATYRCINPHTATQALRPDLDIDNGYWIIALLHARRNTGTQAGDLTSYNTDYAPVAIGPEATVLRANSNFPGWRYIYQVPGVYYVAPNGIDTPDYGTTPNTPWASIKYACARLLSGTVNQQAAFLLSANKDFLLAEMWQWMQYQKNQSLAPFSPSSVFDETKTKRDASYVLDALLYDITRGGNSQTVAATLAYFATSTTFVNSAVTLEMPYFIAALNYLGTIIPSALTNLPPAVSYQTQNSIAPINQSTQVFNYAYQAESGSYTPANSSTITVTNQSSTSYVMNSLADPAVNLVRGNTYSFSVSLANVYPFWIQTTGGSYNSNYVYNKGVLNNGVGNGTLTFTVPYDAPNTLYYQCQTQGAMGGIFNIYDSNATIVNTPSAQTTISSLLSVLTTALTNSNTNAVPVANSGLTASIFVKTGTYSEQLPISIPENVAVIGDELRGVVVQPATTITLTVTNSFAASAGINAYFKTTTTSGMYSGMPIQFSGTAFGGITIGQTYYVVTGSITATTFSITNILGSSAMSLTTSYGTMTVYGGYALSNMFYMRNGSGLRNLTLTGLTGALSAVNAYMTKRPTGGAYVSLDPGKGTNDTTAWIFRRSPYVQNVTTFGTGCIGLKIDGSLHNGGNKSIVCNDFTQVLSDGIGIWTTNSGALCEAVSVFSYYNYAGYMAENGGRIRATNGNSSYGQYGVIAEGFDSSETPITGQVYNRSSQVQAAVNSSLGANAQLLRLSYSNAGTSYFEPTTNLLKYSNAFVNGIPAGNTAWTSNNISISQNLVSVTGNSDAWTVTANSTTGDTGYLNQVVSIDPIGGTYTALTGSNITGSGVGATFDVGITPAGYTVTVNGGGSGYVQTNQLKLLGSQLGGVDGTNDITITVTSVSGSTILTISFVGTIPTSATKKYIVSCYAKAGTSASFDLYAFFTGSATRSSYVNYNFLTNTVTAGVGTETGTVPTSYGSIPISNGWYRVWMAVTDPTGQNTSIQARAYCRARTDITLTSTGLYGIQVQFDANNYGLSYYLETLGKTYTANASFQVTGSGTGAVIIGDETRSKAVFQTRVDAANVAGGGNGYLTASNQAQGGNDYYIILAAADVNTPTNYIGMRIFLNSGTGVGQYGYISTYNSTTKIAQVLKETFKEGTVTATSNATGLLTLTNGDTNQMYLNQRIQFVPTQFSLTVNSTSYGVISVAGTTGGTVNTVNVSSTTDLKVGTPIQFVGALLPTSNLIANFTYYVTAISSATAFQISTTLNGSTWPLLTSANTFTATYSTNTGYLAGTNITSNMTVNQQVTFTGTTLGGVATATTYYVNDIINANTFTISNSLVTVSATNTTVSTNIVTVDSTTSLTALNPIVFTGTSAGGISTGTKYYISKIINSTQLTLGSALIGTTATATTGASNLITVASTSGFVVNQAIIFTGNPFGGLISERIYYVAAINDATSFTISAQSGGSVVGVTNAVGNMSVRTCGTNVTLSTATVTLTGTSTTSKRVVTQGYGAMTAVISTPLFGGVTATTPYYVLSINSTTTFSITATSGSSTPVTLSTTTGSMNVGAMGWDHVQPGTAIPALLDSSTQYFVEPRLIFSEPGFTQSAITTVDQSFASANYLSGLHANNTWIFLASGGNLSARSTDGVTFSAITLPLSGYGWVSMAYGNGHWMAIAPAATQVLISTNNGLGWRVGTLPAQSATWAKIAYGAGAFVAIASGSNQITGTNCAYSTNYGNTWSTSSGLPTQDYYIALAYGNDKFVAISRQVTANTAYYSSNNGVTWNSTSLPVGDGYQDLAWGNGRFVAVRNNDLKSAYSFDGITWLSSNLVINATKVTYGQGVFLAVNSGSSTAWTSEDGINWIKQTVSASSYSAVVFGYTATNNDGIFVTHGGPGTATTIAAGIVAKGRLTVTSNVVTGVQMFEPGSNYTSVPTLTINDPNNTADAAIVARIGNGVLGNPTIVAKGTGYSANSTYITINGNGSSNNFQTGYTLVLNNLTALPSPGDNLTIAGLSTNFKITSATSVYGTTAPNIQANVAINPNITDSQSPADGAAVSIRTKYSQVRLTNHDFLNIGYGNFTDSNYPGIPPSTGLQAQNQTVETNYGRVFYTSTDQDGNFKVGSLFGVQQATGIVTLSVSQFGLGGLNTLSLGGIAVGGSSVIITQFSTDGTFSANSDSIIPTQKAIKTYLNSRLSQGGSNTYTGQLIAGSVIVGNPNQIASQIPVGIPGSSVNIPVKAVIQGPFGAVGGAMAATSFFYQSFTRR